MKFFLMIGKAILNLETKLSRFEAANEKLMDAIEAESNSEAATEFQATLDEDSELIDNIINRVSQLKTLKDEVERKRREAETSQSQNLERRLTQVQEQMSLLQSSQTGELRNIWSPLSAAAKPPQLDIQPF